MFLHLERPPHHDLQPFVKAFWYVRVKSTMPIPSINAVPNSEQTMILCDNYGQAGAINYYAKNSKIKAFSFHDDYLNWFNLEQKTDNVIRIKYFKSKDHELEETSPFLETAYAADSFKNPYTLEYGTTIFVF